MKLLLPTSLVLSSLLMSYEAAAQKTPLPIYVTPFYNSEGPVVNVGPLSRELATATAATVSTTVATLHQQYATLPALTMYVAAVRLYDLGQRDEALYWFYSAQYRARLFQGVLDESKVGGIGDPAFELRSAHGAFQQLVGEYLNGYAGCDRDRWLAVLARVRHDNQTSPKLMASYPGIAFKPTTEWKAYNEAIGKGLGELADYLKANWATFEATRRENGTDKRFCN